MQAFVLSVAGSFSPFEGMNKCQYIVVALSIFVLNFSKLAILNNCQAFTACDGTACRTVHKGATMLHKIKGIGGQVATTASDAAKGISTSVKHRAESIASATISATEAINDKTVRSTTAQICSTLEIAIDEIKSRPLSEHPISLTSSVDLGVFSMEIQVHLEATDTLSKSDDVPTQLDT